MDAFRRLALFTVTRDASFVTFAASILMVAYSFKPALAFNIGAGIALLFSLILVTRAWLLSDEGITRTEPWRFLEPEERPEGDKGRRWAHERLEYLMLVFAKAASAVAIVLSVSSLVTGIVASDGAYDIASATGPSAEIHGVFTPALR